MQLSIISTLALFGSIIATPTSVSVEKRAAINSVQDIVNVLGTTVSASTGNITALVTGVQGNVEASVVILAKVSANFDNIKAAFDTATIGLAQTTAGTAGGLFLITTSITQAQIDQLTAAVVQTQAIVDNIRVTVVLTATDLVPAALALVSASIAAAEAAIISFTTSLEVFAEAVSKAQLSAGVTVTGLTFAVTGLKNIVASFVGGLLG